MEARFSSAPQRYGLFYHQFFEDAGIRSFRTLSASRPIAKALSIVFVFMFCGTHVSASEPSRSYTGNVRSRNFVVTAVDPPLASKIAEAAERYRKELAIEWLGREIPDWRQPCVITAHLDRRAFGETSFSFAAPRGQRATPFDFVMQIHGDHQRLLDSVLPHEITHTIFATHFGQPLPRWADEGACTTVEHISERRKNHRLLIEFLTTRRGIPFNQMFAMKQYPRDILPLYAQGYSLSRFLIQRGGKRKFISFLDAGMKSGNWNRAVKQNYQIDDLSDLQIAWLGWIKQGCPEPNADRIQRVAEAKGTAIKPDGTSRLGFSSSPRSPNEYPVKALPSPSSRSELDSAAESDGGKQKNIYLREAVGAKSTDSRNSLQRNSASKVNAAVNARGPQPATYWR